MSFLQFFLLHRSEVWICDLGIAHYDLNRNAQFIVMKYENLVSALHKWTKCLLVIKAVINSTKANLFRTKIGSSGTKKGINV